MENNSIYRLEKDYELIIYDFDGTLVDMIIDWNGLKTVLNNLMSNKNTNLKISELIFIAKQNGQDDMVKSIFELIEEFEWDGAKDSCLKDAVVNHYFSNISSNKNVAILTNNMNKTVKRTLIKHKMPSPQLIIGRSDVENIKPDIEGILKILSYFKIDPENALLIGDSENDKIAAKKAKVSYIHPDQIK
jgi:phosphoglycolate phosphatase-like HAD superfamily hydrolase